MGPLALLVAAYSGIALWGWLLGVVPLLNPLLGPKMMAPTTALMLFIAASYLLYWYYRTGHLNMKLPRLLLGLLLVTVGLSVLVHCLHFQSPDLERLLFPLLVSTTGEGSQCRMSPTTAFCFVVLGFSLLYLHRRLREIHFAQLGLLFLISISLVCIVGYLYGEPRLYSIGVYSQMSFPAAVCFLLLGLALLLAYPTYTVTSIFAGGNLGGYVARRLLPLTLFLAVFGGELCILGQKYSLWSWSLGTAWQVVFEATCSSCLVALVVVSLNKIESGRAEMLRRKEKLAAQRNNFISVLTQDLKNPLIGAEQVLAALISGQAGELAAEQRQVLELVQRSNHELLVMVQNLLSLFQYDRDVSVFEFHQINLEAPVREALSGLQQLSALRKVELVLNSRPDLPPVRGDAVALSHVVSNLVQNAIKFSPEAGAKVTIDLLLRDNRVLVRVNDQGPGLTEDERDKLFRTFAHGQVSPYSSGTGLGLYLCYQIVQSHGGELSCESKLGRGSTFIIALPPVSSSGHS
ncbi:MAG: HAMP domain-containing sensor histidine kinase [Candidatus Obscuribacter sp.]|nr:HAMP domain-containing sensor histidine kinase [Candidatus Obscuribacter sp.]